MTKIQINKDLSGIRNLIGKDTFVIMDNNLKHLCEYFKGCRIIGIETSEQKKRIENVLPVIDRLLDEGADRGAFILGVGGGITTDIAGFVASVYKRGVRFAFLPTTLLAQADASIGGKNGVNFESYKNIIGTINQPEWVYICAEVLRSLPAPLFRAGAAEVLKTFVLFDREAYDEAAGYFAELNDFFNKKGTLCNGAGIYGEERLQQLISKCAMYKSGVVERDAYERGERRLLNLGHTFAHAIEKVCADAGRYAPIMHGEAVSIGMVLAAKVAARLHGLSNGFAERLKTDLGRAGLPVEVPCGLKDGAPIAMEMLLDALKKDKKVSGGAIHFILPDAPQQVTDKLIPFNELEEICRDLR